MLNRFRLSLLASVAMSPDGGGSPAPAPAPAPTPAPVPADDPNEASLTAAELRTMLREKRRAESGLRDRLREAENARETALAAAEALKTEHTTALTAAQEAADARHIKAELRMEATKAGIVDLDGLALMDLKTAGVKIDKEGNITGAAEAIAKLKETKPFLFAGTGSTSNPGTPPKPAPSGAKKANEMSPEEWRAERARLVSAR